MFSPSPLPSTTLNFSLSLSIYICIYYTISLPQAFITITISSNRHISLPLYIYWSATVSAIVISPLIFIAITQLVFDMLRTTRIYFLFMVFVILSRTYLCDSRRLGPMEKKPCVNRDHLIAKNNEEVTKLEAPSTNETKTLSSVEHAVANHGQINGKRTKDGCRVKRASVVKTVPPKRVSRTWKVPKYSKKRPRPDQEHPGFNLDYMQPTTHPPHHN